MSKRISGITPAYDFAKAGESIKMYTDPVLRKKALQVLACVRTYATHIVTHALNELTPSVSWRGMPKCDILRDIFQADHTGKPTILTLDADRFTTLCSEHQTMLHGERVRRAMDKNQRIEAASQGDLRRRRLIDIGERLKNKADVTENDRALFFEWAFDRLSLSNY